MSATGPPCIKLSCFSTIAVINDIILSKIRSLNTAFEAADGWNTDYNFIKFQELFDRLHSHPA